MKLAEEGKINLNDPLRHYMPQLPQFFTEVKIANLLNHTSGIPDYLTSSIVNDGITNQEVYQYLNNLRRLDFIPGNKFRYSNSAYVLLAMVIEIVSGQSFELYLGENFFTPLGMSNTFVFTSERVLQSRVIGYDEKNKKQDYTLLTTGDGGIYSTTKDLFLWTEALNNGQVLADESLQAMYTPVRLKSGREKRYGFGWELGNNKSGPFVYHSGQLAGFRTYLEYQKSNGKTIIILTNNSFDRIADLRNQLVKILDGRITNISEE
jgi:CubicO group peptidase (beta-lactamase class C family)